MDPSWGDAAATMGTTRRPLLERLASRRDNEDNGATKDSLSAQRKDAGLASCTVRPTAMKKYGGGDWAPALFFSPFSLQDRTSEDGRGASRRWRRVMELSGRERERRCGWIDYGRKAGEENERDRLADSGQLAATVAAAEGCDGR